MHDETEDYEALERELRDSLGACAVPEGFADRVLARLPRPKRRAATPPWWWWGTAAALLLLLGSGMFWQYAQQQRIAGERARAQALLALRLTAAVLNDVQQKVALPDKGDAE